MIHTKKNVLVLGLLLVQGCIYGAADRQPLSVAAKWEQIIADLNANTADKPFEEHQKVTASWAAVVLGRGVDDVVQRYHARVVEENQDLADQVERRLQALRQQMRDEHSRVEGEKNRIDGSLQNLSQQFKAGHVELQKQFDDHRKKLSGVEEAQESMRERLQALEMNQVALMNCNTRLTTEVGVLRGVLVQNGLLRLFGSTNNTWR